MASNVKRNRYAFGEVLGKGGFGKCYRATDVISKEVFACKVLSKTRPNKDKDMQQTTGTESFLQQVSQEISIHHRLDHNNIVRFCRSFQEAGNVYIVMKLCPNKSLSDMLVRRRNLTETETKYFFRQIVSGCEYLHSRLIVHRDLKPKNLFISDRMEIKIGDFGLSVQLTSDEERRYDFAGTRPFMAPEMLAETGHGREVDAWAVGCILYNMLVGKTPFFSKKMKDTCRKIAKNRYSIPGGISPDPKKLIRSLLQHDPRKRPVMADVLKGGFITTGFLPSELSTCSLTMMSIFEIPVRIVSTDDEPEVPDWVPRRYSFQLRVGNIRRRILCPTCL